jgi:hypothetical protein
VAGIEGHEGMGLRRARAALLDEDVSGRVLQPGDGVDFIATQFEFVPGELVVEPGSYSCKLINDGKVTHSITFSNGESFEAKAGEST